VPSSGTAQLNSLSLYRKSNALTIIPPGNKKLFCIAAITVEMPHLFRNIIIKRMHDTQTHTFAADDGSKSLTAVDTPTGHRWNVEPLSDVHKPAICNAEKYLQTAINISVQTVLTLSYLYRILKCYINTELLLINMCNHTLLLLNKYTHLGPIIIHSVNLTKI